MYEFTLIKTIKALTYLTVVGYFLPQLFNFIITTQDNLLGYLLMIVLTAGTILIGIDIIEYPQVKKVRKDVL